MLNLALGPYFTDYCSCRASPRKAISAEDKGPVPPARKTNGSLANTDSY